MKKIGLIDWGAYLSEWQSIEELQDKEEARCRQEMLEEIKQMVLNYASHVRQYEYERHAQAILLRGLEVVPVKKKPVEKLWDEFFASTLSANIRKKIYYSDFKWHMFSYGQVAAIAGKAANEAYDRQSRGDAYLFFQCTNEAWQIKNADLLTADDLNVDFNFHRADFYLFDSSGRWCYVHTHEPDLGPWFLVQDC